MTWTCRKKKEVYQESGGGGKRCTDVLVWLNNRSSRTRRVIECEIYKEERDVLEEEMGGKDE